MDVGVLLERTSRTFALAIPLLDEPLRAPVGLAYLLFRIADTLEDAPRWKRDRRHETLVSFTRWLEGGEDDAWQMLAERDPPTDDPGCLELLACADEVRAAASAWPDIARYTGRTATGMAEFVAAQDPDGRLVLAKLEDLTRYAYVVAGIVGELLTALFAGAHPSIAAARAALDEDAAAFGECLQLVNILKDAGDDAKAGRSYLPPGVPRADVAALARADVLRAARYVATLRAANAPRDVVVFCALPLRLAEATLDALDRGEPKLGREAVLRIFAEVTSR